MKKRFLIFLMLLIPLANLVYAADGHGEDHSDERMLFKGHYGSHDVSHHSDGDTPTTCIQAHACHAHSHIFSLAPLFLPLEPTDARHQRPAGVAMPPQQGAAPPNPPPIV